jgi:glycosyltransferase involved in cell wall biosynthesis
MSGLERKSLRAAAMGQIMRILYFHQHFSTPAGSTANRSYHMARALIAAGHDVHLVCGSYRGGVTGLGGPFERGKRSGIVDGIQVTELALEYSNHDSFLKRTATFLRFAMRCVWMALRERYDLVFATSTPLTAGIPGIFARWLRRKRFIFEVRDLWPELPREMGVITNPVILWLMSCLEWTTYRSAHACVGLSPGIVEGIQRRGRRGLPIAMIPNGCDNELFAGLDSAAQRPDAVLDSDLMTVFTGTHGIANGLDAVLNVAAEIKARGRTDIKFVFIGDGKLKPELVQHAEERQLDNCIFLDPVPKKELVGYLRATDLGLMILANVQAFYRGTSPNKFFDYLAVGLPVLNNYPGWLAEIIRQHDIGFPVPPDDPQTFADRLEDAADHREKLNDMGQRARQLARTEFARDKLATQFVKFLEQNG